MLRLFRGLRSIRPVRAMKVDPKNRERKARLEIDPYDNPMAERESSKPNTGTLIPVEPWPRRKLKELYLFTLEFLKELPEDFGYRVLVEEMTRFRLKVVEEIEDIPTIEKNIGFGQVEDLIKQAQTEIKLIEFMKRKS